MVNKKAQEMMMVESNISQVLSMLRSKNIMGPMRDYAEARMIGAKVDSELARAAYNEAMKHVNNAVAKQHRDTDLGVSVRTLQALMNDIKTYAKTAANRETLSKLANKFEKTLKTRG